MYYIHSIFKFAIRTWQLPVTSILLFGMFSTLAGQKTDQLIDLTCFHMDEGQETAFITENAKLDQGFDIQPDSPYYVYELSSQVDQLSW